MAELSYTDSHSVPPPSQCLTNGSLAHHAISPPEPRLPSTVFLQRPTRKPTRPSTAPAIEDVVMLPVGHSSHPRAGGTNDAAGSVDGSCLPLTAERLPDSSNAIPTRDEDELVIVSPPPGLNLASLPASYPPSQESSPRRLALETRSVTDSTDLDWPTFIHAYANGRWDPHRTPHRPSVSSPSPAAELPPLSSAPPIENPEPQQSLVVLPAPSNGTSQEFQVAQKPTFLSFPNSTPFPKFPALRPTMPLNLPPSSHRLRNSFSNVISTAVENLPTTTSAANAELQTTVATMRWAAARVDISPLALPSPEHELADPMRGVTATIPGAHPPDNHPDYPMTPGGTRRSRLTEFWEEIQESEQLSTLVQTAAPAPTAVDSPSPVTRRKSHLSLLTPAPPATAPPKDAYHSSDLAQDDYFGNVTLEPTASATSDAEATTIEAIPVEKDASSSATTSSPPSNGVRPEPPQFTDVGTVSVPAVARRICLTRQFSSPLPAALPIKEARALGGRVVSDLQIPRIYRLSKEEQLFDELEYLVPPDPPDELDRRRALCKYNIWNTGPDNNFDRIAHLAKLVFNTKGVTISLIDSGEIWYKSEWGLKVTNFLRSISLCGHAILQRGDEPMVVMDTHADWRFARNPLVIGGPRIRFYAGAPLRTQDGFNIGTLTLIDDAPRDEFSPRQRHTLKEFAAIVMREMELWRDKIQLRIRDRIQTSMEQFSRECLEIDEESPTRERSDSVGASMDKVYDRAAKLVKRTLDVEGVIVMDVSHCQVLETMGAEANVAVTMHFGEPGTESRKQKLTTDEYHRINVFFSKYPEGKISEGIIPACFRPFLPTHIQYALTVPIYNIDKQLFALICAYNASDHTKRFLEGHELSYLRAIGVIILSAVLKRRMILADKAKSLFISNISHELRTPLHGATAAELLGDTPLNPPQLSYLQTVQACGTSLVETVNHVLDFTKLSGNAKSGGVEHVITPSRVDLMQLVEEAVDGCWVGHRARTVIMGDSGIGSVYSPPKEESGESPVVTRRRHVETIIDIGYRREGWMLKCEKGGIRRVLMNLFGNSLKFTSDGYIHVTLHQLPRSEDDPPHKVRVELVVLDSGKGISQNFLKNQLFHPFSQENPLQTGTGLGLAIVSSIVTSEVVGGKVDVWSQEGVGTEIKVTFSAEIDEDEFGGNDYEPNYMEPIKTDTGSLPTISLVGFDGPHRGTLLLERILHSYLEQWWHFDVTTGAQNGDILILNEDVGPVIAATENHDISRPFIILSGARGSPSIMHVATEHERVGGFCRILYKPGGPSRLRSILKLAVRTRMIGSSVGQNITSDGSSGYMVDEDGFKVPRRNSEEGYQGRRPAMAPRSSSAFPALPTVSSVAESTELAEQERTVVPIGESGTLLKSSIQAEVSHDEKKFRVLVVEDNGILRNLLTKWLANKGYEFRYAVDGQAGVSVYSEEGPFDVVLLDLSMPVLDGVSATAMIRKIEDGYPDGHHARILALTGMSSLEDKRRAFEAGVDGYLIKPVAFKILDEMFRKMGLV
ncbi:Hybrid signal transduction histidine kinase B [Leucoagaricus sp. SymC.cos]|nr:Hybrid signal transduction histidine kinase B [Leucoagaricus sp. SymC.cos]